MKTACRIFVVYLMALMLPAQSFAATLAHCAGDAHHSHAVVAEADHPCAHHTHKASTTQQTDQHADGAACGACCAALASQVTLSTFAPIESERFAIVDSHFVDFIPSGLKRPPSV